MMTAEITKDYGGLTKSELRQRVHTRISLTERSLVANKPLLKDGSDKAFMEGQLYAYKEVLKMLDLRA